jgi:hypothetical protein
MSGNDLTTIPASAANSSDKTNLRITMVPPFL